MHSLTHWLKELILWRFCRLAFWASVSSTASRTLSQQQQQQKQNTKMGDGSEEDEEKINSLFFFFLHLTSRSTVNKPLSHSGTFDTHLCLPFDGIFTRCFYDEKFLPEPFRSSSVLHQDFTLLSCNFFVFPVCSCRSCEPPWREFHDFATE